MINIAIVEDEKEASQSLKKHLERYSKETGENINVDVYNNPTVLLENYSFSYSIIFMDIMMPEMNGIDVSKRIRDKDKNVIIIFTTNLAKYAIKGYEVGAFDFVLKPIIYEDFKIRLSRVLLSLNSSNKKKIIITSNNTSILVFVSDIKYVEVSLHKIILHTNGGNIQTYGSLKKFEDMLPMNQFSKCNKFYLVNLEYVTTVSSDTVYLKDEKLMLAIKRKKSFKDDLVRYLGEKGNV